MKDSTRRKLDDLVDIGNRIAEYGFDEHIRQMGLGFHMQKGEGDEWTLVFDLPEDKERDATLYALRLFDQQNEDFSFHNLTKLVNDPSLSDDFRQEVLRVRDAYFTYLNGSPENVEAGFFEDGVDPTRGELMRVVMNGALGHRRDRKKRERYLIWARDEIREAVLHQEFAKIIYTILVLIKEILELSTQELQIDAA